MGFVKEFKSAFKTQIREATKRGVRAVQKSGIHPHSDDDWDTAIKIFLDGASK